MATATPKAKTPVRTKMRIKKGDTVQVIAGKDKGKTGEVLRTLPTENRVIVQGINLRTRHVKPTQEGETGRIVTEEASVRLQCDALFHRQKGGQSRRSRGRQGRHQEASPQEDRRIPGLIGTQAIHPVLFPHLGSCPCPPSDPAQKRTPLPPSCH
jgi:large subunit ribosomal protein L24